MATRSVLEIIAVEPLPLGASGSRRAIVRWSDGTTGEALRWWDDGILFCEGDIIDKTEAELRRLHFTRDRDYLACSRGSQNSAGPTLSNKARADALAEGLCAPTRNSPVGVDGPLLVVLDAVGPHDPAHLCGRRSYLQGARSRAGSLSGSGSSSDTA